MKTESNGRSIYMCGNPARDKRAARNAFTLIELLVVIAIKVGPPVNADDKRDLEWLWLHSLGSAAGY